MTNNQVCIKVRRERNGLYSVVATAPGYSPASVTGFGSREHAKRGSFLAEADMRRRIEAKSQRG